MLEILKNDFNRIFQKKQYVIVATILTIISIVMAVFITNNVQMKITIGLIDKNDVINIPQSKYLNVINLDTEPKKSDVVMGKYDAIVEINDNGESTIISRNDELKNQVQGFLDGKSNSLETQDDKRNIGSNIIGYMMMFLLMQGVIYGRVFGEDKEKHIAERITISPVSFRKYIAAHILFTILMIFVPSYMMIVICRLCGINIGFNLIEYAGLLILLAVLSSSFSIFLQSIFKVYDTANMAGNSVIVLTSLLSGSFYSFTKETDILDKIVKVLPQKDFMSFTDALEKGLVTNNNIMQLVYILLFIIIIFSIAVIKTKKDYVYK